MELYGIDVSHYQGTIDWKKVKSSGKRFAILKVSQGATLKDSCFETYYKEATANGIALGVYIYNKVSNVDQALAEATFAVKQLAGKKLPLGVWLDLEDKSMRGLGKATLNAIIEKEASVIKAAGFMVNIYCNKDWYLNVLDSATLKKKYKFWIARYPSADNGTLLASLRTDYMDMWQYSSKGSVNGIKGNVDMNAMYDVELIALAEGSQVAPTKKPNPYKEPTTIVKNGTKGEGAKWVQFELVEAGYSLTIDGIFGAKSDAALRDFQKKNGLVSDGLCGAKTREKLKEN